MGVIVTRFFCYVILMPASLKAEQTPALWLSHQHAPGGLRPLLRPLHIVVGFYHSSRASDAEAPLLVFRITIEHAFTYYCESS